jgi:hypothetical protein
MTKQLNVRSDRAYKSARRLSADLGMSTTAVVETALERMERDHFKVPSYDELNPEQKSFADKMLALARKGREEGDPKATSDHSYLYDEIGAPK